MSASVPLEAGTLFFQGAFGGDDELASFSFQLSMPGTVTIQTFSYAGGTDGLGHVILAGGFDPVITLFDSLGNFLNTNNDGPCGVVGKDPVTQNCFDSYLSLNLGAGDYQLYLSESDNLAVGPTLADGFTQSGNGNFSCPEFMGTAGPFCDASPSQRNGEWALDVITPSNTGPSPAPEPATPILLLSGAVLVVIGRKKFTAKGNTI